MNVNQAWKGYFSVKTNQIEFIMSNQSANGLFSDSVEAINKLIDEILLYYVRCFFICNFLLCDLVLPLLHIIGGDRL